MIWIGIKGLSLTTEEKSSIQKHQVSGVILFKRNIQSLGQLLDLCHQIKSLNPAPLIAMDREGGQVDRLRHLPEFSHRLDPSQLAKKNPKQIKHIAFTMAREMKAIGIAINFAPVVDIPIFSESDPIVASPLLKGRLFGLNPQQVAKNSLAWIKGFSKAGLASCVKHFPGHGGVKEDSHQTLPIDNRDKSALEKQDLIPFKKAISAGVDMVMTAHIAYPHTQVGPTIPAKPTLREISTLSPFWLKTVLRDQLGFKGLVVSDDLSMKALTNLNLSEGEIIQKAFSAGVDIGLQCEPPTNLIAFLEQATAIFENQALTIKKQKQARIKYFMNKYSVVQPLASLAKVTHTLDQCKKAFALVP